MNTGKNECRAGLLRDGRGAVALTAALALTACLAAAGFVCDLGRVVLTAQRVQAVADASALAGATAAGTGTNGEIVYAARQVIQANSAASGDNFRETGGGITVSGAGDALPGGRTLIDGETAVTARVASDVPLYFLAAIGQRQVTVVRQATAARAYGAGSPIAPMWMSYDPNMQHGQVYEMHEAASETAADIPGNFGWLDPPTGASDFFDLLSGAPLSPEQQAALRAYPGAVCHGLTGEKTGQWVHALKQRLDRATQPPFEGDTWDDYLNGDPRIILVPLVEYLGGTGSNATYRVITLAAFWLQDITKGQTKSIQGRFVEYVDPHADVTSGGVATGIWTVKLMP